jgi:hypothetical protein
MFYGVDEGSSETTSSDMKSDSARESIDDNLTVVENEQDVA